MSCYQIITYGALNNVITEFRYWSDLDFGIARQADPDENFRNSSIFSGGELLAVMALESVVVLEKGKIKIE